MNDETLFHDAMSRPPGERVAFLQKACEGDPDLLAAVLARLAAHEVQTLGPAPIDASATATGEFAPGPVDAPSSASETLDHRPAVAPQVVIAGRYTLLEKLGEGGMGEVWVARQSEPVKRKVALKLIKPGMDTRSVLLRFEQERQALALMEHPNIARVIDGGMTADHRPFFVMELVNGLPLTDFCDQAKLNIRQRLELFAAICQAVQHAHQKGIIHRDLKPTNILVTVVDGKPVPKVIDFGVAKATAGKLTDETMSTQLGGVVGTLEYMSPEQAGMSGEDIDTRADIYSLGVILYEMLTGLRPIDAKRLKAAALTELIRIIREEDPSKPSTRLSTDDSAPSMAALRQIEPRKLSAMLRGELDWVVMKCLEKRRDRRYETANALNRDIQRYLADEPVEARPPSAGYLLGKFLHRNQGAVIAAALVLLALIGGIIGTSLGLLEAKRQEHRAVMARDAETKRAEAENRQRQRAEKAEAETKKRADELEQVAEFQAKLFEDIDLPLTGVRLRADLLEKVRAAGVNAKRKPEEVDARVAEVARDVAGADFSGMALRTLEQSVLVPSLEAIEKQFAGQPLVRARLQDTLAVTARKLGLLELADKPQFAALATRREKLGTNHPDTLRSKHNAAQLLRERDRFAEAEALYKEALEGFRKELGDDDPRTLDCLDSLAALRFSQGRFAESEQLYNEALTRLRRFPERRADMLSLLSDFGGVLIQSGKFDEAEKFLLEAYRGIAPIRDDEPQVSLTTTNNLGTLYLSMNRFDDAERYLRLALEEATRYHGDLHPSTITIVDNLGSLLMRRDRIEEAEGFVIRAYKDRRTLFGDDSATTMRSVFRMASLLRAQKKFPEAEAEYRKALDGFRRLVGPDRSDTLIVAFSLGIVLKDQGKLEEAEAIYRAVLEARRATLGATNRATIASVLALADLLDVRLRGDESLRLLVENEQAARGAYTGSQLMLLGDYLSRLGDGYARAGQFKPAEAALDEARKRLVEGYGPGSDATTLCDDRLISMYRRWNAAEPGQGHDAGGEALLQGVLKLTSDQVAEARKQAPPDDSRLAGALAKAGARLVKLGRSEEAEPILRESLALRQKAQPGDWRTFASHSLLGEALLGRKNFAEAEPLLLTGFAGMKEREGKIPLASLTTIPDALDRLARLYDAMNKPDEAAKWRQELARTPGRAK